MALTTTTLITSSEVVTLLTAFLGPIRPWESFLAEIRRSPRGWLEPAQMHGEQLLPFGRAGVSPRYVVGDAIRFIKAMWAADPGLRPKKLPGAPSIDPKPFEHDDSPVLLALPASLRWKQRKLTPAS